MWLILACGSAFFAGITSILAKLGLKHVDSTLAVAIRTIIVLIFSWIMVWISGSLGGLSSVSGSTLLFLILSGLATGASWLCYFKALQHGPVAQVLAIDKSSTVVTIVLSFILLHETITSLSLIGTLLIAVGTWLMLDPDPLQTWKQRKKQSLMIKHDTDSDSASLSGRSAKEAAYRNSSSSQANRETGNTGRFPSWILFAAGSALFASLTAILGKIGIESVDSNLGTAIRTIVVLIMAWAMVFISKKQNQISSISKKELVYLLLSGVATGASWLCYFSALQQGPASVVVPVDKLSILISVLFSVTILHEHVSRRSVMGLAVLCVGTLLMIL